MSNEKLALSVTETAELLGVSRPTVYQLIHREDFPAFKVGTRTLISRAGLAAWVEKQSAPAVAGTTAGAGVENCCRVQTDPYPRQKSTTAAGYRQGESHAG